MPMEVRQFVIVQVKAGFTYEKIVQMVKVNFDRNLSKGSITGIISKYNHHDTVEDLQRSGRPSKLSEMEEEKLIESVEQNRKLTASIIAKDLLLNLKNISARQVTRILNSHDLIDDTSIPQPSNDRTKARRFEFALHEGTKIDWDTVIFSDESDLYPDRPGKIHSLS